MYIDTGSPVPNIPSKSRGLADENKKFLTERKWLETPVFWYDFMELKGATIKYLGARWTKADTESYAEIIGSG